MCKKAIGYARKSIYVKGIESELEGVQYQLTRIHEYAKKNDYELLETYSDVGYSGVLKSRPELNRMLSFLKSSDEKINSLILYSQVRLARDLSTSIELMLEITDYVDEIIFAIENERETGIKFIESFLVKAAQYAEERRILKERLRYGREVKVADSNLYRSTYKPIGYIQKKKQNLVLATYNQTTDPNLLVDFRIVQYIFLSYLSNLSYRQIAKQLNEHFGLTKRGKEWEKSAVKEILRNPVYAGLLSGEFVEEGYNGPVSTIEPLISVALFRYIQLKIESEKPGNKPKQRKLFPEIVLCMQCFKPLVFKQNEYSCEKCQSAIPSKVYIELVKKEFTQLLEKGKIQLREYQLFEEKKHQISIKIFRLQEKLQSLKDREEELLLEYRDFKEKREKLLNLNIDQQREIQMELKLERAFYNALFSDNSSSFMVNESTTKPLLAMPYCILVDFKNSSIYAKYHETIFEEVNQSDTFSIQMVNKGIRVCKDIG